MYFDFPSIPQLLFVSLCFWILVAAIAWGLWELVDLFIEIELTFPW